MKLINKFLPQSLSYRCLLWRWSLQGEAACNKLKPLVKFLSVRKQNSAVWESTRNLRLKRWFNFLPSTFRWKAAYRQLSSFVLFSANSFVYSLSWALLTDRRDYLNWLQFYFTINFLETCWEFLCRFTAAFHKFYSKMKRICLLSYLHSSWPFTRV